MHVMKQDTEVADQYITSFAQLMRLVLRNSLSRLVTLDIELSAIRLYIEMEQLRFDHGFECHIEVDNSIDTEDCYIPPMVIQPYVENAIWHGLMHLKRRGQLMIYIRDVNSKLQLIVEDNGIGRKRSAELQQGTPLNKSFGTRITGDRIRLIRESLGIEASVMTEDLVTEEGNPAGTRVLISLPFINAGEAAHWLIDK